MKEGRNHAGTEYIENVRMGHADATDEASSNEIIVPSIFRLSAVIEGARAVLAAMTFSGKVPDWQWHFILVALASVWCYDASCTSGAAQKLRDGMTKRDIVLSRYCVYWGRHSLVSR